MKIWKTSYSLFIKKVRTDMYKTILVPHSGTEESDKALKHAIHAEIIPQK